VPSLRTIPHRRLALAALFAVVIPAASWVQGSGALAYRMYARSASYRLRVTAWDAEGRPDLVAPTALAARARGAARLYLAGADRWRTFPRGPLLGEHLADLAQLACATARAPTRVVVELDLRSRLDGPVETRARSEACR
jgi:hypothetical protein